MASIVYLTSRAPAKLTDDLMLAGHKTTECLSVAEVLNICEREWVDVVLIGHDVEDPKVVECQLHQITLHLKPGTTSRELIWELSQLFPNKASLVQ